MDALAEHGAPLWSSGRAPGLALEQAVAQGFAAAPEHPSLLHVLPIVLHRNRLLLSWPELRSAVPVLALPALGMLLDLAAEVTGPDPFRAWADELRDVVAVQDPPRPFFTTQARSVRYLELAWQRTPAVVRRWGFLMATPLDDFRAAVVRHCGAPAARDEASAT